MHVRKRIKIALLSVALCFVVASAVLVLLIVKGPIELPRAHGFCLWGLKKVASERVVVRYDLPDQYAQAIACICEAALDGYQSHYGIDIMANVPAKRITVVAVWGSELTLCTLRPGVIYFRVSDERQLRGATPRGGVYHVYGFAHELGHHALDLADRDRCEAVAGHLGTSLIPFIHDCLGDTAWPQPYDYLRLEGERTFDRHEERFRRKGLLQPRSAYVLRQIMHNVEVGHGPLALGAAILRTRQYSQPVSYSGRHPCYSTDAFIDAIVAETADNSIRRIFHGSETSANKSTGGDVQ